MKIWKDSETWKWNVSFGNKLQKLEQSISCAINSTAVGLSALFYYLLVKAKTLKTLSTISCLLKNLLVFLLGLYPVVPFIVDMSSWALSHRGHDGQCWTWHSSSYDVRVGGLEPTSLGCWTGIGWFGGGSGESDQSWGLTEYWRLRILISFIFYLLYTRSVFILWSVLL